MLTYLFLSKVYYIKTEYEVEGGYIDIALLPRINVKAPNHAIIELKYITKKSILTHCSGKKQKKPGCRLPNILLPTNCATPQIY